MQRFSQTLQAWRLIGAIAYRAWPLGAFLVPFAVLIQQLLGSVVIAFASSQVVVALQQSDLGQLALWLGVIALSITVSGASIVIVDKLQDIMEHRCVQAVNQLLMQALIEQPSIEQLEVKSYTDKLKFIRNEAYLPSNLFLNLAALIGVFGTLAISFLLLANVHWVLALCILLASPIGLVRARALSKEYALIWNAIPDERLAESYLQLAVQANNAKEIMMFQNQNALLERYQALRHMVMRTRSRGKLQHLLPSFLLGLTQGLILSLGLVFLIYAVVQQEVAIAQAVLGITLLRGTLNSSVTFLDKIGRLIEQGALSDSFLQILNYQSPLRNQPSQPLPERLSEGIHFQGVSFAYPSSDRLALRDLSFTLPAGKVIAIVGENGSGKTSLLKLIARLYDPNEGEIRLDSAKLTEVDLEAWRANISLVQQDFAQYHFRLRESVGVGDLEALGDDGRIRQALNDVGSEGLIEKLPDGLDSQLGREFQGGSELSLGQWQRVALARARMKNEPLILILDEPMASLDPFAERAILNQFRRLSKKTIEKGGIVLLVSHRLELMDIVDLVVVLEDGRLREIGSHSALSQSDGLYAELMQIRAQNKAAS
jgi:ATP-binding cassette subfamily B protein